MPPSLWLLEIVSCLDLERKLSAKHMPSGEDKDKYSQQGLHNKSIHLFHRGHTAAAKHANDLKHLAKCKHEFTAKDSGWLWVLLSRTKTAKTSKYSLHPENKYKNVGQLYFNKNEKEKINH